MIIFLFLHSCLNEDNVNQDTTITDLFLSKNAVKNTIADNEILNVERIDSYIFSKYTPFDRINKILRFPITAEAKYIIKHICCF